MLAPDEDGRLNALQFSHASEIIELVVLTADDVFLQTLRDAVGGSRRLWHVPSAEQVSDLLVAGQVGILVLDVPALHEAAPVFVSQIKRQFPDLVVVVAGNRDAESLLAGLISTGTIYRFIHKPMSPARAKLFADAAVKRHIEQRRRASISPLIPATAPIRHRLSAGVGCGILAAVIAAAWFVKHESRDNDSGLHADATGSRTDSPLLARASAALAANRLTPPTADNALELYLQELARNPSETAARRGLAEVHERLLSRAQNALLEERLDEAAGAIETARKAGAESGRIALLSAQLARSRFLVKMQPSSAQAKIDSNTAATADGTLTEALSLADERTRQGQLLEPETDSARYYVERALRISPNSDAAQAAEQSLAMALVTATHSAIDRKDFARAANLLDAARGVASPTNVNNLDQLLRTARQQTPLPPQDRTAESANDAASAVTAPIAHDQLTVKKRPSDVIGSDQLTLIKSVQPVYPSKAQAAGTEGWVELEFTVTEDGQVKDIAIQGASPAGVFDSAARVALSQWRFSPVQHDSGPTAQRAHLRIRFTLRK